MTTQIFNDRQEARDYLAANPGYLIQTKPLGLFRPAEYMWSASITPILGLRGAAFVERAAELGVYDETEMRDARNNHRMANMTGDEWAAAVEDAHAYAKRIDGSTIPGATITVRALEGFVDLAIDVDGNRHCLGLALTPEEADDALASLNTEG